MPYFVEGEGIAIRALHHTAQAPVLKRALNPPEYGFRTESALARSATALRLGSTQDPGT